MHAAREQEYGNIVVRASDTDIAIILLYHVAKHKMKVWMDVGTTRKDTRCYIDITSLPTKLGAEARISHLHWL